MVNLFLPKSLTKIDNDAFKNCSQLKNLEYLGETNSLSNCSPFSNGGTNPSNLYLPNVDTGKTNDFTNFLGKNWNGNIYAKKHIPS